MCSPRCCFSLADSVQNAVGLGIFSAPINKFIRLIRVFVDFPLFGRVATAISAVKIEFIFSPGFVTTLLFDVV